MDLMQINYTLMKLIKEQIKNVYILKTKMPLQYEEAFLFLYMTIIL